jgi:hypothetical protein
MGKCSRKRGVELSCIGLCTRWEESGLETYLDAKAHPKIRKVDKSSARFWIRGHPVGEHDWLAAPNPSCLCNTSTPVVHRSCKASGLVLRTIQASSSARPIIGFERIDLHASALLGEDKLGELRDGFGKGQGKAKARWNGSLSSRSAEKDSLRAQEPANVVGGEGI